MDPSQSVLLFGSSQTTSQSAVCLSPIRIQPSQPYFLFDLFHHPDILSASRMINCMPINILLQASNIKARPLITCFMDLTSIKF